MSENIFYTKFSEISSSRLDPFFYIPELVELENKVKKVSTKKLKDFVVSVSSGATPKKSISNEYYLEDEKDGIPFLRVQNLTKYGKLDFNGLKFITKDTHEKMLKRSQVKEDDLLVKITGVGRMAIASVPEKGFVGNTNQHMVVIKTKDRKTSETLATYLNLDIAEKLASRRATGGTRPALDYPALLSIPVIYDEDIVSRLSDAYKQKEQKEKEAQKKLNSIDTYLLNELGIKSFSNEKESLADRVFFRKFSELSGDRFDSDYKRKIDHLDNLPWNYQLIQLKDLMIGSAQYGANETAKEPISQNDIRYIRITDIDSIGNLKKDNWKTVEKIEKQYFLNYNDILFARSGSVGKCYIHKEIDKKSIFAGYLIRFFLNEQKINPDYFFFYCNSSVYKYWVSAIERPAVQSNINSEEFRSLKIPLPPIKIQNKIVNHIQNLRDEAQALKKEAIQIFEDAKKEVENMILGEKNA